MNDKPSKFASVKLTRSFVERIKIEAARAKVPMYLFLEDFFHRHATSSRKGARV